MNQASACLVTILVVIASANSAGAAERPTLAFLDGLDDAQWPPKRQEPPIPWEFNAGIDMLYGRSTYTIDDAETEIGSRWGTRIHGAALVHLKSVFDEIGMGLGLGVSRSRWSLTDSADMHILSGNAIASIVLPGNQDSRGHYEFLISGGVGSAGVNDIVDGIGYEFIAKASYLVPLGNASGWFAGIDAGGYFAYVPENRTKVKYGDIKTPVDMQFSSYGATAGISIGWHN